MKKVKTLTEFVKDNFYNQADFADQIGTSRSHVTKWKRLGYVVIDGILCKKINECKIINGLAYQEMRILKNKKGESLK